MSTLLLSLAFAFVVGGFLLAMFLRAAPPSGNLIIFKGGRNKKYCGVDRNKNIQCAYTDPVREATFIIEAMPDGRYALKNSATNQYCQDHGDQIICNRNQPLEQEKFHWKDQPEPNTFALVGPKSGTKGYFCADEGNRIRCDRKTAGPWEKFEYQTKPYPTGKKDGSPTRAADSATGSPPGFWAKLWMSIVSLF